MANDVGGKRAGGQARRQNTWPSVSVKKDTLAVEAKVTWLPPARRQRGTKCIRPCLPLVGTAHARGVGCKEDNLEMKLVEHLY